MDLIVDSEDWVTEQFSRADFRDVRRGARAKLMLRRALARPAGKLSGVFRDNAELQGAYDFVRGRVPPEQLMNAFGGATARQVVNEARVFVPLDGSSVTVTDRTGRKGFGSIGMRKLPTKGLKVISAYALTTEGVPVGLLDQQWWSRGQKSKLSRALRRKRGLNETKHWLDAIETSSERLMAAAPTCTPCFIVDREGDNSAILRAVASEHRDYVVRLAQNRPVTAPNGRRRKLWSWMKSQRVNGVRVVGVPAGPNRRARVSEFDLRTARVTLDLPNHQTGNRELREIGIVYARERRAPYGEKRLEWMLATNLPVSTPADAELVLDAYCLRWRIEDFHKTWKSGRCNVEDSQLRKREHVMRWAMILAAVATRVEQLKHLARTTPDAPASTVLTPIEIEALIAAKKRFKRPGTISNEMPSISKAVLWIAELGGYTGKSSGGPPGSITIGRGLEWLMPWTAGYEAAKNAAKTRSK